MTKIFRSEFTKSNLGLHHYKVSDFTASCWQRSTSPLPLLVFRLLYALLFVAVFVGSYLESRSRRPGQEAKWFIYLTHWGVILIIVTGLYGFVLGSLAYARKIRDDPFDLPWFVKAYWVMLNATIVSSLMITVVYWTALYRNRDYISSVIVDFGVHGANGLVMFVELVVSGHPTRLLHVLHPLGFGIIYLLFSIIFFVAGGTGPRGTPYIYPILNWQNPGPSIGVVIAVGAIIIILHILTFGLSVARQDLAETCQSAMRADDSTVFSDIESTSSRNVAFNETTTGEYRSGYI